jgi:hypothetical protein
VPPCQHRAMSSTRVARHLDASPDAVYRALIDRAAVARS